MGDNDYIDSVLNANRDLNWVKRLYEVNPQSIQIPGQTGRSTHFLESADSRVYPTVVQLPDGSLKYLGPDAYDYADSTNSYIQFPTDKKAQWFAKNYKQGKDVLKGFESEKQQQTKGKKSMPNNPKKKAGESGKAAAQMMAALSDIYEPRMPIYSQGPEPPPGSDIVPPTYSSAPLPIILPAIPQSPNPVVSPYPQANRYPPADVIYERLEEPSLPDGMTYDDMMSRVIQAMQQRPSQQPTMVPMQRAPMMPVAPEQYDQLMLQDFTRDPYFLQALSTMLTRKK